MNHRQHLTLCARRLIPLAAREIDTDLIISSMCMNLFPSIYFCLTYVSRVGFLHERLQLDELALIDYYLLLFLAIEIWRRDGWRMMMVVCGEQVSHPWVWVILQCVSISITVQCWSWWWSLSRDDLCIFSYLQRGVNCPRIGAHNIMSVCVCVEMCEVGRYSGMEIQWTVINSKRLRNRENK